MCKGVLLVVSRIGEIYNENDISEHERIITENNINDNMSNDIIRVAMLPKGDLFSTERNDWECSVVDELHHPNWFLEDYEKLIKKCYNKLWLIIFNWSIYCRIDIDLNLRDTELKSLGDLRLVSGNLNLENTKIISLGKLEHVNGSLNLRKTSIVSLGNLKSVNDNLNLQDSSITSLGKLTRVGGNLDLENTNIKSLENLEYVGEDLNLCNVELQSLGNLKSVGWNVYTNGKQATMDLRNLERRANLK
jgi:hypothetical protein